MKLQPDCLRDVLIFIEAQTSLFSFIYISQSDIPDNLSDYSYDEIAYHIKQAELSNLIAVNSWYLDGGCTIKYLLPAGHKFLEDIREDTNWAKTKEISKKIGSFSIETLQQIASNVIASLVRSHFGL